MTVRDLGKKHLCAFHVSVVVVWFWMSVYYWSRLVVIGIMSESVATGHEGFLDNACVLCWQTGVLGPEKVNWQICTHSSASNLSYSPQAKFHATQVSTVELLSLF